MIIDFFKNLGAVLGIALAFAAIAYAGTIINPFVVLGTMLVAIAGWMTYSRRDRNRYGSDCSQER